MTFTRRFRDERSGVDLGTAVAFGLVTLVVAVASGRMGDVLAAAWITGRDVLAAAWAVVHGAAVALVDVAGLPILLGIIVFAVTALAKVGAAPRT